jgi:VWFA-related protein
MSQPLLRPVVLRAVSLLVLLLLPFTGSAQTAGTAQEAPLPVIRSESRLVQIPVVVTDKQGKPVTGLKRDAFEIIEDKTARPVALFEEVHTGTERAQYLAATPGVYDNQITGTAAGKRLTIIVLDTLNTSFQDQTYARTELIKFLSREVDANEPVALLTIGRKGTRVVHDFTEDPQVLIAALRRSTGEMPAASVSPLDVNGPSTLPGAIRESQLLTHLEFEYQAQSANIGIRIDATLEALQHIAQAFAVIPGRKSLLWVTGGIPFQPDSPVTLDRMGGREFQPSFGKDFQLLYRQTFQALNEANVAVYPVDPHGVTGLHGNSRIAMQALADMTGGRAFYESNDLSGLFQKAANDCSAYYMLGYYLPSNVRPGWHELHIKIGGGLNARARSGFFTMPPPKDEKDATERRRLEVSMALASPLNYTAMPIAATWLGTAEGAAGKKSARFQLNIAPAGIFADESQNNSMSLELVAAVRDSKGKDVDHFAQHLEANLKPETLARLRRDGLKYSNTISVPPGEYEVRFVVRDNLTGRTGSVLAPLKVM